MDPSSTSFPATEPRERDIWMTYIAQTIIKPDPVPYPNIPGKATKGQDEPSRSESYHSIGEEDNKRIEKVVRQHLPYPEDKTSKAVTNILTLCAENEPYPYDLVLRVDQMMEQHKIPEVARIARIVCDQMMKVYQAMIQPPMMQEEYSPTMQEENSPPKTMQEDDPLPKREEYPPPTTMQEDNPPTTQENPRTAQEEYPPVPKEQPLPAIREQYQTQNQLKAPDTFQDDIRRSRFSLRRVLYRFCKDTDVCPANLFSTDITLFASAEVTRGTPFSDIYRIEHPRLGSIALKTFRVFEVKDERRQFSRALRLEAIILVSLKHKNLLPFIGLYAQPRQEIELTYIVSPWMPNGDILSGMYVLNQEKKDIPRMRWIYEIASGLTYLHDECVVHGSLHGRNILVDSEWHLRIADFDLSSLSDQTASAEVGSDLMQEGVTWWSAPELADEGADPSPASDVWAFGCACLLIWTGAGPYRKCSSTISLVKMLMNPTCTPEDSDHPMNTFPDDNPKEQARGATLRTEVALPCWSLEPEDRPQMNTIKAFLLEEFGPF